MNPEESTNGVNRRDFVKRAGIYGVGVAAALSTNQKFASAQITTPTQASAPETTTPQMTAPPTDMKPIPRRKFGSHDDEVSIIGVGGFHLGEARDEATATRIVHEAIAHGINFMDNCWDYHDGMSEERMGKALKSGNLRDKVFLMTKVCTHGRDATVAMKMLEDSLRRLQTDHLDLWQIHEVAYENDPDNHFKNGGVVEALLKAKEQGKVRYLGFTGHKKPELHKRMLSHDFPFDSVQMPLNPFDANFRSFQHEILPILNQRNIAAIGMKSLGGTGSMIKKGVLTPREALGYAMSLPVTVTVSGMDSLQVLYQNLAIAGGFVPLSEDAKKAIEAKCASQAGDGRFELYKTSAMFEGDEGRKQHGFPIQKEMCG